VIRPQSSPERVERIPQLVIRHPREKPEDVDGDSSTEGEEAIEITGSFELLAEIASQRERSDG